MYANGRHTLQTAGAAQMHMAYLRPGTFRSVVALAFLAAGAILLLRNKMLDIGRLSVGLQHSRRHLTPTARPESVLAITTAREQVPFAPASFGDNIPL